MTSEPERDMGRTPNKSGTNRGQLDNGWQLKVMPPLIAYIVVILVAFEAGFTLPTWIPEWILLIPPLGIIFWWVPLLLISLFLSLRRTNGVYGDRE